jgi:hypothetical protein
MKEKRRDNKGRILHTGESQRTDGKYLKGMLIFIVADIWNCYNMDNKIILA